MTIHQIGVNKLYKLCSVFFRFQVLKPVLLVLEMMQKALLQVCRALQIVINLYFLSKHIMKLPMLLMKLLTSHKCQVICLNVRFLTVQKVTSLKYIFLSNLYYEELDKYIRMFLRYCCQLLDKTSRSYGQKSKIKLNLAEIIAEFTNCNSV